MAVEITYDLKEPAEALAAHLVDRADLDVSVEYFGYRIRVEDVRPRLIDGLYQFYDADDVVRFVVEARRLNALNVVDDPEYAGVAEDPEVSP